MRRRKKQVFRVCGRRCGQARFCGSFSTGEFPPQATVPRTSGVPLLGEWIGHLSSQTTCAANCANPGYPLFCMIPRRARKCKSFVSAVTAVGQIRLWADPAGLFFAGAVAPARGHPHRLSGQRAAPGDPFPTMIPHREKTEGSFAVPASAARRDRTRRGPGRRCPPPKCRYASAAVYYV